MTKQSRTLTLAQLKKAGACKGGLDKFKTLFGESVEVTEALCAQQGGAFDPWRACLLSPEGRARYKADMAAIEARYKADMAAIWARYDADMAPIQARYKADMAPIEARYDADEAPIWARYYADEAPIRARCEADMAVAWGRVYISEGGRS